MRRQLLTFGMTVALILTACGGGDSGETTTSTVPKTTTSVDETSTSTDPAAEIYVGADGVEANIGDASRVVSLNGDLTEIIFELGLGDRVVAVDVTTVFPEVAAALIDRGNTVGFAQQLSAEAVLRFEPTLVIGDQQVGPPEVIEQLREAGIPVVILETQTTLDGVSEKIEQVAEIMGVAAAGAQLADRVAAEIASAQELIDPGLADLSIAYVYARGPQTIFLFGAGTATQAMIEGAGAVDAGAASGVMGLVPVTPEAMVAAAPEVIVLPESGIEAMGGLEAFLEVPGIGETPAGQSGQFLIYDEAYFFNLGPRVGQALAEFITDLQAIEE